MKVFVGTIIVIISMCIIAFDCWYTNFYMVAFGRGLPEATSMQRLISTLFTSVPLLVSIYLALRYLIFERDDRKIALIENNWSLSAIAAAFVCFSVFWYFTSTIAIGAFFTATQRESEMVCEKMETDAYNAAAAIADYFSYPEHITLPTAEQLMIEGGLTTDFSIIIEQDADGESIVKVVDDKDQCPRGKRFVYYFSGKEAEWLD